MSDFTLVSNGFAEMDFEGGREGKGILSADVLGEILSEEELLRTFTGLVISNNNNFKYCYYLCIDHA